MEQFDSAQGLCQRGGGSRVLRALCPDRAGQSTVLSLPGAAFLLGLDAFDVIT